MKNVYLLAIFLLLASISFGQDLGEGLTTRPAYYIEKPVYGVKHMPQFPGGEEQLKKFIRENLHYPKISAELRIEGRVTIRFVINRKGDVSDITVIRGLDPPCDKEAVRIVKKMPRWTPGHQNGRTVPVYYTIPIIFKLQK